MQRRTGSFLPSNEMPSHARTSPFAATCGAVRGYGYTRPREYPLPAPVQAMVDAYESRPKAEVPQIPPLGPREMQFASRRAGVIAIKAGMTQEWDEWGARVPLTVLWIDDCQVRGHVRTAHAYTNTNVCSTHVWCAPVSGMVGASVAQWQTPCSSNAWCVHAPILGGRLSQHILPSPIRPCVLCPSCLTLIHIQGRRSCTGATAASQCSRQQALSWAHRLPTAAPCCYPDPSP